MLFNYNIEPKCAYCHYATDLGFGEVICIRRGIMSDSWYCGAFRYEPTKRLPHVSPGLKASGLSDEDFSL